MRPLRVAMAGTGRFAELHLQKWRKMDGLEVSAVFGRDREKAQAFSGRHGIERCYTDLSRFREAVSESDILDVVTVPSSHIDMATHCMDDCRGVLIEKPIDIDIGKAARFMNELRKRTIVAGVISQLKYGGVYKRLRELVSGGHLGDVVHFSVHCSGSRGEEYYCCDHGWRDDRDIAGGGVLISQGIHRLNFIMSLYDYDVDEVFAVQGRSRYAQGVEESAAVIFRMGSGSTGTLHVSSISAVESDYLTIEGTEAAVLTNFRDFQIMERGDVPSVKNSLISAHERCRAEEDRSEDLLYNQMREFAHMVRVQGEGFQNVKEAINDMIILHAVYESMRTGRPVKVTGMTHDFD